MIINYIENVLGRSLPEWQRTFLRDYIKAYKRNPDQRVIIKIDRKSGLDLVEMYKKYLQRELNQNGETTDSHN